MRAIHDVKAVRAASPGWRAWRAHLRDWALCLALAAAGCAVARAGTALTDAAAAEGRPAAGQPGVPATDAATGAPNIAFYYDRDVPADALQAFDAVVIDPSRGTPPAQALTPHTAWLARLDLSERTSGMRPEPATLVQQRIAPLWQAGFRGFLLDDGAPLADGTDADAWLEQVLSAIHAQYPAAQLILRNHLALAARTATPLYALALDALYRRYDPVGAGLLDVPPQARASALEQIRALPAQTQRAVVAIDYCARADLNCRRDTARRLRADGLTPFVTDPAFATVGVGRIEVMPRKILMVQALAAGDPVGLSIGVRDLAMPLNYLGYDIQYADLNKALPERIGTDRYAGIVVELGRAVNNPAAWRRWLLARVREGMHVAVVGQFGFQLDQEAARVLGLETVPGTPPDVAAQIVSQSPMMAFEILPAPDVRDAVGIRVGANGKSLLRLRAGDYIYDMAGLTAWGGYTLNPYGVASLDTIGQERWAVQPLTFLRQALALPDMPVPDVTTENGRRLMFVHVDGDGFASRTEFPGPDYGAQALYEQVFTHYPIPMTLSVIEGEVGPGGMYPALSPRLEAMARKVFALPNVEIGSHTYSHPFYMEQIDPATGKRIDGKSASASVGDNVFALKIPDYTFDLDREIQGSIDYINRRLAPAGKQVVMLQWPGDAQAPAVAVRRAYAAGVLNINGGDTVIVKNDSSWTNIAPYGVATGTRPDEFQTYASVMDENVYTNDWTGPFYGYRRVLETFAMTDQPIRFKALNIYYHFYSGTKLAALQALRDVYDGALRQAVLPVYTSEYVKRVLDWRRVSVARDGSRWLVRSGESLRELRWPFAHAVPVMGTALGVSGYLPGPGGVYVHMSGDQASFEMVEQLDGDKPGGTAGTSRNAMDAGADTTAQADAAAPARAVAVAPDAGQGGTVTPLVQSGDGGSREAAEHLPYVAEAAGFIRHFVRDGRSLQLEFAGYYQPFIRFADAARCRAQVDGHPRAGAAGGDTLRVDVAAQVSQPLAYHSIKVDCE